jgi:hypothetical protein
LKNFIGPLFSSPEAIKLRRSFCSIASAIPLCSCAVLGYGTRVEDLGNDNYLVLTPSTWDVPSENARASQDQCPDGFIVRRKGLRPDSGIDVLLLQSDYAGYWLIRCK